MTSMQFRSLKIMKDSEISAVYAIQAFSFDYNSEDIFPNAEEIIKLYSDGNAYRFDMNVKTAVNSLVIIQCSDTIENPEFFNLNKVLEHACSCATQGAVGVIISLPLIVPGWSLTGMWKHGIDTVAGVINSMTGSNEPNTPIRTWLTHFPSEINIMISIPVLFLMQVDAKKIEVGRRNHSNLRFKFAHKQPHELLSRELCKLHKKSGRNLSSESITVFFNTLNRSSQYIVDFPECCTALQEASDESTFPVFLALILRLSQIRGDNIDSHCFEEAIRDLLYKYVVSYFWTRQSVSFYIERPVVDILFPYFESVLVHREGYLSLSDFKALVPLFVFYTSHNKEEPQRTQIVWEMTVKYTFKSASSIADVRKYVEDLKAAINKLTQNYHDYFSHDMYLTALRNILPLLEDLEVGALIDLGTRFDGMSDEACTLFGNFFEEKLKSSLNSKDIEEMWKVFKQHMPQESYTGFHKNAKNHILTLFPMEMVSWMKCSAYVEADRITFDEFREYVRRDQFWDGDEIKHCLDLFELYSVTSSMEGDVAKVFVDCFRKLRKNKNLKIFEIVVSNSQHIYIEKMLADVILVLKEVPLVSNPGGQAKMLNQFLMYLGRMPPSEQEMSRVQESVFDVLIEKFFAKLPIADSFASIFPKNLLVNKVLPAFLDSAISWYLRENMEQLIFGNAENLLRFLENFNGRKFHGSVLYEILCVARQLSTLSVRELLNRLQDSYDHLGSDDAIGGFSLHQLDVLINHKGLLEEMQRLLLPKKHISMIIIIDEQRQLGNECKLKLLKEQPFLSSLLRYIPQTMRELDDGFKYSVSENALQNESLRTLQLRWDAVSQFAQFFDKHRAFYTHFELEAKSGSRSVLFKYFIEKDHNELKAAYEKSPVSQFVSVLECMVTRFSRLLLLSAPPMRVLEIVEITKVLNEKSQSAERELRHLAEFFIEHTGSHSSTIRETLNNMQVILDLIMISEPLLTLVGGVNELGILQSFGFVCALPESNDSTYMSLSRIGQTISDMSAIASWDSGKCSVELVTINMFLGRAPDLKTSMAFLSLFHFLTKASKVWEFFLSHPEFIGEGYNQCFDEKVEEYLSDLGGEDYKILDNFKLVASWVTLLISKHSSSFDDLMSAIASSPCILRECKNCPDARPFSQLLTAQDHMNFINDLFQYGLSGLDAVLGQLKNMELNADFLFDVTKSELRISYFDDKRGCFLVLSHEDVMDYQQRLGFIQHEARAANFNIRGYMDRLEKYRRCLLQMHELQGLCHPRWGASTVALHIGSERGQQIASVTEDDLDNLEDSLTAWQQRLSHATTESPLFCLISADKAQRVAKLVQEKKQWKLSMMVSHLFGRTDDDWQSLKAAVRYMINQPETVSNDWISEVAVLFKAVPVSALDFRVGSFPRNSDGPIRYICRSSQLALMQLLGHIFRDRAPLPFEVLWCSTTTSIAVLSAFLLRTTKFPKLHFVLLQVDRLTIIQQNLVMNFILENRQLNNVDFVETGISVLQTASWLPVLRSDACDGMDVGQCLRNWVQSNPPVVNCFYGPVGSGKTFQFRKAFSPHANCSRVISLNEDFVLSKILSTVQTVIIKSTEKGRKVLLLAFQLNLGKFRTCEKAQLAMLLKEIDLLFFNLLVLRSAEDPSSDVIVNIPPGRKCKILVEIPDPNAHLEKSRGDSREQQEGEWTAEGTLSMVREFLPVLSALGHFVNAAEQPFEVDKDAAHVAKYLKAYETGAIDKLYQNTNTPTNKNVIFVLDNSGSMEGFRLETCKRSLLTDIFATRLDPSDRVGLIVFNSEIDAEVKLAMWTPEHKSNIERVLGDVTADGGTAMWSTLFHAAQSLVYRSRIFSYTGNNWLVVLTDGDAHDHKKAPYVASYLRNEGVDIRVLFITVALAEQTESFIRQACIRDESKGDAMVSASADSSAIQHAWKEVGDRLTVSKRIEKEGENMSLEECERLLRKYMDLDGKHRKWTRLHQRFWVRYMRRRCGILASSERFNKNNDRPKFGSTTMAVMLEEVERALSNDYQVDWHSTRHAQIVYRKQTVLADGKEVDDYTWSILATDPDDTTDKSWRQRKALLSSLRMIVPSLEDLSRDRCVLDSYLGYGLGVSLVDAKPRSSSWGELFDFDIGSLPVVDKEQFVLTLDFVMKMLITNERIECRVPCILEGETGISKTALTRMLFTIKNEIREESALASFIRKTVNESKVEGDDKVFCVLRGLAERSAITQIASKSADDLCIAICSHEQSLVELVMDALKLDPSLDPLESLSEHELVGSASDMVKASKLLLWYVQTIVMQDVKHSHSTSWTFFSVNVHGGLTQSDICEIVSRVVQRAGRLLKLADILKSERHRQITLCVFFDEFNTSRCMGLLKEIICDHSMEGKSLPENVVIIAACNPSREKVAIIGSRREEHGSEWVSGHYQVHPLPQSLKQMAWNYGSLLPSQEREFIEKCLVFLLNKHDDLVSSEVVEYANLIYVAHQATRELATEHVKLAMKSKRQDIADNELLARASSSVSLRDILRVLKVYEYLLKIHPILADVFFGTGNPTEIRRRALLLSIGVMYYLRLGVDQTNLDNDFRRTFRARLKRGCGSSVDVEQIVSNAMENLLNATDLGPGIAKTRGLQENVFMVFLCCIAQVPLMIVGPPGSSKTLAVTIITENARGEYSKTEVYRTAPTLVPFHYQCSRRSTSNQIKEVFERAIERQAKADRDGVNLRCFVFMDEAGLPEEERESLKVLHYYLEDHMSVAAQVGFVAISNHVLDAAKSNRCALLTRAKPDREELLSITKGCLGPEVQRKQIMCTVPMVRQDGRKGILKLEPSMSDKYSLLDMLCESYECCMNEKVHPKSGVTSPVEYVEFFGLRDYMHFIKLLGRLAFTNTACPVISSESIVEALERNMNGVERDKMNAIINFYMAPFEKDVIPRVLRSPVALLLQSFQEQFSADTPLGRYLLVIDTTTNDAVLRGIMSMLKSDKGELQLFKLSDFAEDAALQQINLISRVRWATEQGQSVVLSHTESVNESFYDLFNQHFRKFEDRSGNEVKVVYHTNIAVGAHSRRCKVVPGFQCIVHLTLAELQVAPAPFLNRFEKYRVTIADFLNHALVSRPFIADFKILKKAIGLVFNHLNSFVSMLGERVFYGYAKNQTIESIFLRLLSSWTSMDAVVACFDAHVNSCDFCESIERELYGKTVEKDVASYFLKNAATVRPIFDGPKDGTEECIALVFLSQMILRESMRLLLQIAIPDQFLRHSESLPRSLLDEYLKQETFHLRSSLDFEQSLKQIVYMRNNADLLTLQMSNNYDANVMVFSEVTREHTFTDAVKRFLLEEDSRQRLIVLFDITQISPQQINFARCKLDELMSSVQKKKVVTFLIHIPSSDLLIHHNYDSTLHDDWSYRFIDSLESTLVIPWVLWACTGKGDVDSLFDETLHSWLCCSVSDIAQMLEVKVACDGKDVIESRIYVIEQVLNIFHDGESLKWVLFQRYKHLWSVGDTHYQLLKEEVRRCIRVRSGALHHGDLLSSILGDVRHMFTKYLGSFLANIFEDITPMFAMSLATAGAQESFLVELLYEGLLTMSAPPLAALLAPFVQIKTSYDKTYDASCFPFSSKVIALMDSEAAVALLPYTDYEGDDVWDRIQEDMTKKIDGLDDPFTNFVTKYCLQMSGKALDAYVNSFVVTMFPEFNQESLQYRLVKQLLTSHEAYVASSCPVCALHAIAQHYKGFLSSLATAIEPLSKISSDEEFANEFVSLTDGHEASGLLHSVIVQYCYRVMLRCGDDSIDGSLLSDWVAAVREIHFNKEKSQHQLLVFAMVVLERLCSQEGLKLEQIKVIIQQLNDMVQYAQSKKETKLSLRDMWSFVLSINDEDFYKIRSKLLVKLVEVWSEYSMLVDDLNWLCDSILCDVKGRDYSLLSVILELMVFGHREALLANKNILACDSLTSWLTLLSKNEWLESHLFVCSPRVCYLPYWFDDAGDQEPQLSHVFFHLTWKWLLMYHSQDEVAEILRLAQSLENQKSDDESIYTKRVALGAVRTLLVHRLTKCIIDGGDSIALDDRDQDRLMGQVETMRKCSGWGHELLSAARKARGNDALLCIKDWKAKTDNGPIVTGIGAARCLLVNIIFDSDVVVLAEDDSDSDSDLVSSNERPNIAVPPKEENELLWKWTTSSGTASTFVQQLLIFRRRLYLMWVVPDLLALYAWLSSVFMNTPISEETSKRLTVRKVIENVRRTQDGFQYLQLWVRVRAGLLACWDELRDDVFKLDENACMWDLLSSYRIDGTPMNGCLYDILVKLISLYHNFLSSAEVNRSQNTKCTQSPKLDEITEVNCEKIQAGLNISHLPLQDQAIQLDLEIRRRHKYLDYFGELASKLSLCYCWKGEGHFDTEALENELGSMKRRFIYFGDDVWKTKYCRFSISSITSSTDESYFSQILHSLEYHEIGKLIQILQIIQQRSSDEIVCTIRSAIAQMYPGTGDDRSASLLGVSDREQGQFLLSLPLSEISKLLLYLNYQMQSAAYIFAHKSVSLKQRWPEAIEIKLKEFASKIPTLADQAKVLDAFLIKNEMTIACDPKEALVQVLAKAFLSKASMFKQYPLLEQVIALTTDTALGFQFLCAHYVSLRLKLREWGSCVSIETSAKVWDWPFLFVPNVTEQASEIVGDNILDRYFTPWFLLEPPDLAARMKSEHDRSQREAQINNSAISLQRWFKNVIVKKTRAKRELQATQAEKNTEKPVGRVAGRGRGRGRGGRSGSSGRGNDGIAAVLRATADEVQMQYDTFERLSALCRNTELTVAQLRDLQVAISTAKSCGIISLEKGDLLLNEAENKACEMEKSIASARAELSRAKDAKPFSVDLLRIAVSQMENIGGDFAEMEGALRKLREAERLQTLAKALLQEISPNSSELLSLVSAIDCMGMVVSPELEKLMKDLNDFRTTLLGLWYDDSAVEHVITASDSWSTFSSMQLPPDGVLQKAAADMILKLHYNSDKAVMRKGIDAAVKLLEKPPLDKWEQAPVYLALAYSSPTHVHLYGQDVLDFISVYIRDLVAKDSTKVASALLLAVARVCPRTEFDFRVSCLRKCDNDSLRLIMTNEEKALLDNKMKSSPLSVTVNASNEFLNPVVDPITARWTDLRNSSNSPTCPSLDLLMKLIGLEKVKQKVLDVYESVSAEQCLLPECRVPQTYHFALLGNPGTGKSTVGRLLGKILYELRVRRKDSFIETTGEKLARMGADKVAQEIDKATGGVLFIDEAYALDPSKNADGASAALQLLDIAEEKRTDLTIILAGYKDDIERQLFDFNDGFTRRFPFIMLFEDYTENQLASIFQMLCDKFKWTVSGPEVISVAAKRVARGRGRKNFGNAGAVRNLFETSYRRALNRNRNSNVSVLTMVDVIGPPPSPEQVPDLCRALEELNEVVGLESVKAQIHRLVQLAMTNYNRELRGEAPYHVPLNRVFFGNPGTGKTTVAKLYGRVLKGLGLLSDGSWEMKQPNDLLGSHVGETQKRTASLIQRCMGKVLIIDEAYCLNGPLYGAEALDTLVGLVHGAPGEDIAVVMIGYEKQMKKMFREMNPGLTRRFALDDAFIFDDYSDSELERLALKCVSDGGLSIPRDVRKEVLKALSVQRFGPNFGNAGAVVTMVSRAKERLCTRDDTSKILTLEDFGLTKKETTNALAPLSGLYKIDHIINELFILQNVLQQCEHDGKDKSDYLKCYTFLGNPGTGKTTVAKAMAQILNDIGVLGRNSTKIFSGQDLQGSYLGQTKDRVNDAFNEAQGGLLFIDEAYTLGARQNSGHTSYAQEAIDQIVAKMTEPEHLNKTMVILAGYPEGMNTMLSQSNVGLRSRFTGCITFPDWDARDCVQYIKQQCVMEQISLTEDAERLLLSRLEVLSRRSGWANARDCITTMRLMYEARATRCHEAQELNGRTYCIEDVEKAMSTLEKLRPQATYVVAGSIAKNIPAEFPPSTVLHLAPTMSIKENIHDPNIENRPMKEEKCNNGGSSDNDGLFSALLVACRQAGYDQSHEKRKELVAVLEAVQSNIAQFPDSIIEIVVQMSGLRADKATKMLRPQVHRVLDGMMSAVRAEEERQAELLRLEEEERLTNESEHARLQENLHRSGLCPMGFTWHRCGNGWRCAGGSHFVAADQLPSL